MQRLLSTLPLALAVTALPLSARAAEYFVAPSGGNDSGACTTTGAPCATVEGAQAKATAGDTVWIRGGTYSFSGTSRTVGVSFTKAGGTNNPIKYFAYMNESPVFDLTNLTPNARVTGFDVNTSWIHVRGIEIRGVQQFMAGDDSWGLRIRGSNNVIERMNIHHNEAPGVFITSGANNRIVNCDSHHNYDQPEGGGSGDGFGCHSTGAGNVMTGCRAWSNSDDGYDFINAPGVCTAERSWAFSNGYVPDTTTAAGNGAGFKAGGFGSPPTNVPNPVPRHVVRQCIAFGNRAQGFYANHHPGGLDFFNNLGFRNPVNYNMLTDTTSNHTLRNNISMNGTAINNFTGGTDTFNSWTLSVTVSAADFLSTMESEATAARQPDGSLPNVNFMRLAANSDVIDKGTNVGLPFNGSAPDLGPFETGSGGAGGMGNAGGMAGRGGSAGAGGAGNAGGVAGGGNAGGMSGGGNVGGAGNIGGMGGVGNTAGMTAGGTSGMGMGGMGTGNVGGGAGVGGVTNTGGVVNGGAGGATAGTGNGAGSPMGGTSTGTSGAGVGGASSSGAAGAGNAAAGPGAGDDSYDATAEDGGCTCRAAGTARNGAFSSVALLTLISLGALRRRKRRA